MSNEPLMRDSSSFISFSSSSFFLFLTPYFLRQPTKKYRLAPYPQNRYYSTTRYYHPETQRRIVDGRRKRLDAVQ
jgi:hypothetical protein